MTDLFPDPPAETVAEPEPETRRGSRRDSGRARAKRKKVRRRRTAVVMVVCLALVGAAGYGAYGWIRPIVDDFNAPTDYEGAGTDPVEVTVDEGDTGQAIAQTLADAGVVLTTGAFVDAFEAEPDAASIQPGTYALRAEMQASQALSLMLEPGSRISLQVQVIEGRRAAETLETIGADTGFSLDQLTAAASDPAVGLPPEAGGDLEGYLFPATYSFEPDVTPVEVLATMVARYTQAMDQVGVPADQRRDVLVRASLVEAEGRLPDDLPRVARVIQNRLDMGMPLQFDSTVNFATGKTGITTTAEDRAVVSPYNTYAVAGLPPGPINSPGEASIRAAAEPADGPWVYFVAVNPDTGETNFATTAEEHAANVELFRQWLRENS